MAQDHLDRLTAVDASFLHQEGPASHMHVGALTIFEGPAPPFEDFLDSLRERLHLVPRYRQHLSVPPLETGRPLWVDDPSFNLEYHVRQTALPSPGSEEQLRALAGRIFSQQLDRSRPLWELWVVENLESAGSDATALRAHLQDPPRADRRHLGRRPRAGDVRPDAGAPRVPHPDEAWQPAPEPTPLELRRRGRAGRPAHRRGDRAPAPRRS